MPSKLPPAECRLVEQQLHQSILRQGFRHGMFHVEGRIRHSSMRFTGDAAGEFDLYPHGEATQQPPSVFLHEVNARPPGYNSCSSSLLVYGVDYWDLQMLFAVEDWDCVRALSIPFRDGAQGVAMVKNIPVPVDRGLVKKIHPAVDVLADTRMLPVGKFDPMAEIGPESSSSSRLRQHTSVLKDGAAYGSAASTWWWLTTLLLTAKRRDDVLLAGEEMAVRYEEAVRRLSGCNRMVDDR